MNGTSTRLNARGFGSIAAQDGTEYCSCPTACGEIRFEDLRPCTGNVRPA